MIILQIILSVIAWFRGWKWYALIPLAVGIIITLMLKYIFINPSNLMTIKLFASISTVVINLVLLSLCIIKKPIKSHKKDNSSEASEEIVSNDEMRLTESETNSVNTVDKEVNRELTDNNEKESIGCEAPDHVIRTKQYYYSKGRKKKGPYTEDEFVKLKLKPETLIWTEGLDKWQPLSDFNDAFKTPPPLSNEVRPNWIKANKRIIVSLVILGLLFGISFISTYYIMENRRNTYLRLINDEIEKVFDGQITLCEGEEYSTRGELRPVSEPIKSPNKSEDTYNEEIKEYREDIRSGAIERFHSEGISFEYQKLIKTSFGFRVQELWSGDVIYFYEATVSNGANALRQLVTPDEAYNNCYRWIINENSECLSEGLTDKVRYLTRLMNRYFEISRSSYDKPSIGSRGTDMYRVYLKESESYYKIEERYSIRQDFIKTLAMFGGISIILAVLLFILNPFKW